MNAVHATARKAHRRRLLNRFVHALGASLTMAGAVALGLIIADRLFALGWSVWLLAGAPTAAALLGAMATAMWRRESLLTAAAHVDQALHLRDRLGSALALEKESPDDPFTTLAIQDAQRVAGQAHVREATPIHFGGAWIAWPVVGSLAVASAIFLPALDLAHRRADREQQAEKTALRQDAQRDIADARQAVAPNDITTADLATPTDLEILDKLEEQLASGEVDPDEARASAASSLSQAAENLDRSADVDEARAEALRDTLSGVDAADSTAQPSPLAEALSAGDFDRAQKLLEQQRQLLDKLDRQEREKLADELDKVADRLDRAPGDESTDRDDAQAADDLRALGVSEPDIETIRTTNDPDDVRRQLREQGVDEPAVERIADELEQERQQKEAQEQAQKDTDQLGQSLRDAADESRREPAEPKTGETRSEEQKPDKSNKNESDSSNHQDSADQRDAAPQPSEDNADENDADRTGADQPDSDQTGQRQPGSDSRTGDKQTQGKQGQPVSPTDAKKPAEAPSDSPSDNGENQSSPDSQQGQDKTPGQAAPKSSPDENAVQKEGATPGDTDTPGAMPNNTPGDGQGFERAKRLLKEFSERQQRAKDKRQSAENARRRARELLDHMSPEQQEQLKRWAKELAREKNTQKTTPSPTEFTRDPVDMRQPSDAPQRTIAQWFNPDAADHDPSDISHRRVDQQLRQAAKGAQRAIEEQTVHRRYNEIIKRYFDTARKKTAPPKPAPQPAKPEKNDSGS